jgi:hypothetical protein
MHVARADLHEAARGALRAKNLIVQIPALNPENSGRGVGPAPIGQHY